MKKVNLLSTAGGSKAKHLAPVESNLFTAFPSLIAHLAVTRYDDGDPRQPGWVTMKTQGSIWQCVAKDPDGAASLLATGQTIDDAIALLELLLGAPDAPWEADRFLMKGRSPGKKSG